MEYAGHHQDVACQGATYLAIAQDVATALGRRPSAPAQRRGDVLPPSGSPLPLYATFSLVISHSSHQRAHGITNNWSDRARPAPAGVNRRRAGVRFSPKSWIQYQGLILHRAPHTNTCWGRRPRITSYSAVLEIFKRSFFKLQTVTNQAYLYIYIWYLRGLNGQAHHRFFSTLSSKNINVPSESTVGHICLLCC